MEPLSTFCLAGIVFLSLPLPVFVSAVLGIRPTARSLVMPWVWAHAVVSALFGLSLITETVPPLLAIAVVGVSFVIFGAGMFRAIGKMTTSA